MGISNSCGMITSSYKILKCKPQIHPKFIFYIYLTLDSFKGLRPHYTGLRNVVRTETFMSLPIYVPNYSEQKQIASFLDHKTQLIDELIEKTKKKIELLKEKRTSLINHCVTKGLNPNVEMRESGVEWIGEIPSGWDMTKMKYETTVPVQYGINIGSESYVDEGIRLIRTTDITDDGSLIDEGVYLDPNHVEDTYRTQLNDFLISRSGTLGRAYVHTVEDNMTYGGYLVRFNFGNETKLRFVFYYTKTMNFEAWLSTNTIQSTIGNVNGQKYSNLSFPIPPHSEQHQIVEYLDEQTQKIDTAVEKETQRIKLLKEYRQSLISEAVTGKIDVREEMVV